MVVAGAGCVSRTICAGGLFSDVFLVGFDPVGGDFALGTLQIQLAGTYELVEFPLERIFRIRVPGRWATDYEWN